MLQKEKKNVLPPWTLPHFLKIWSPGLDEISIFFFLAVFAATSE